MKERRRARDEGDGVFMGFEVLLRNRLICTPPQDQQSHALF